MTKKMDKRQILSMAFDEIQAEILTRYNLTPEQRQKIADAEIEFSDWEGLTPALPLVTWKVVGHTDAILALELMGRNRAPIEALGKKIALKCYQWVVSDLE